LFARGGTLVLTDSTQPRSVLDTLERQRITTVFMPPTLIYGLLDDPSAAARDWSSLRHLVYAAAPMRIEKIREAQAVFGNVATCYGQTEAPSVLTFMRPEDLHEERNLASVGRATLLTEIAIMSPSGELLPPGESGEVVARGDLVM